MPSFAYSAPLRPSWLSQLHLVPSLLTQPSGWHASELPLLVSQYRVVFGSQPSPSHEQFSASQLPHGVSSVSPLRFSSVSPPPSHAPTGHESISSTRLFFSSLDPRQLGIEPSQMSRSLQHEVSSRGKHQQPSSVCHTHLDGGCEVTRDGGC